MLEVSVGDPAMFGDYFKPIRAHSGLEDRDAPYPGLTPGAIDTNPIRD